MSKKIQIRGYDESFHNEKICNPIIKEITNYNKEHDDNDNYFIAFRSNPGRITIYYKGREAISLQPKSKENWYIRPRKLSSSEKKEIKQINKKYQENLKKVGFGDITKSSMKKIDDDTNCMEILTAAKEFLDEYYKGREEEKTIQNKIACKYQKWNQKKKMICIDQEYNQSFIDTKEKNKSNIKGRYDLIMLKKVPNNKIKLIFVELKSKISASTDYTSGIIDHISDINLFLKEYKENKYNSKDIIKESVKFILRRKKGFVLIRSDIYDKIDFENPEFWILYDMVEDENKKTPTTKEDIYNLIDKEITKANSTKSKENINKMNKNKVNYKNKDIPKNKLIEQEDIIKFYKKEAVKNVFYNDFIKIEK